MNTISADEYIISSYESNEETVQSNYGFMAVDRDGYIVCTAMELKRFISRLITSIENDERRVNAIGVYPSNSGILSNPYFSINVGDMKLEDIIETLKFELDLYEIGM